MITAFHVRNFKSCVDVKFDCAEPIVAFVGKNGAGKSNLLKAIEFSAWLATTNHVLDPRLDPKLDPISFTFGLKEGGKSYTYRFEQVPTHSEPSKTFELRETLSVGDSRSTVIDRKGKTLSLSTSGGKTRYSPRPTQPCLRYLEDVLPTDSPVFKAVRTVLGRLSSVRYFDFDEVVNPVSCSTAPSADLYRSWEREDFREAGRDNPKEYLGLPKLKRERPELFDELKWLIGPKGLSLIDDIVFAGMTTPEELPESVQNAMGTYMVELPLFFPSDRPGRDEQIAYPALSQSALPYSALSYGTRRVLRILIALLTDPASVLLIEQPEEGIHPGLLEKVLGVIESYGEGRQVFLTTHSTHVLDQIEPTSLRFVSMGPGGTQVEKLERKKLAKIKEYLETEGGLGEVVSLFEQG